MSARIGKVLKNIKIDGKIHPQIEQKTMQNPCSKKWCQIDWKVSKMDAERGAENDKKARKCLYCALCTCYISRDAIFDKTT